MQEIRGNFITMGETKWSPWIVAISGLATTGSSGCSGALTPYLVV